MKQTVAFLLLLLSITAKLHSQPFATRWMQPCHQIHSSSAVWFKRTFLHNERPHRAFLTIATTSKAMVYVNGRNISTAQYAPKRAPNDTTAIAITYDISRYMRADTNTVAVLVSPTMRLSAPHIGICYYGVHSDGSRYAVSSTDGWLCSPSSTSLTEGGSEELMDGRLYTSPTSIGTTEPMRWLPITIPPSAPNVVYEETSAEDIGTTCSPSATPFPDIAVRPHATLRPRYFNIAPSSNAMAYDFSPGFHGLVRVTLRGCQAGERIHITGLTYICRGEVDEQAFTLFTPTYTRRVIISGDSHFSPEQVQDVEGICF